MTETTRQNGMTRERTPEQEEQRTADIATAAQQLEEIIDELVEVSGRLPEPSPISYEAPADDGNPTMRFMSAHRFLLDQLADPRQSEPAGHRGERKQVLDKIFKLVHADQIEGETSYARYRSALEQYRQKFFSRP